MRSHRRCRPVPRRPIDVVIGVAPLDGLWAVVAVIDESTFVLGDGHDTFEAASTRADELIGDIYTTLVERGLAT